MSNEIDELKSVAGEIQKSWHEFKKANDTSIEEVKKIGKDSADLREKLSKIEADVAKADEKNDALVLQLKRIRAEKAGIESKSMEEIEQEVKYSKAFVNYAKHYDATELKAMSVNSQPDGGYYVTPAMSTRIATRQYETSPVRQLASVQSITTDALEGFTDIDQAELEWVGETIAATSQKTPVTMKWRIPTYEAATRPRITQKLLEDSAFDVEAWLIKKVSERFVRGQNTAFVLGGGNVQGAAQPRGFLTYANGTAWNQVEQIVSGAASAITADGLIDLQGSLKTDYEPNASFAMHRTSLTAVRKLKDSQGAYLWQPSIQLGEPSLLLGTTVTKMSDMPTVAAQSLSVVYADWKEFYQIVDRLELSVIRDPFTVKPYVEFYCRTRVGGDVFNFEAGKILRTSV